jgi:hypothetical protein
MCCFRAVIRFIKRSIIAVMIGLAASFGIHHESNKDPRPQKIESKK